MKDCCAFFHWQQIDESTFGLGEMPNSGSPIVRFFFEMPLGLIGTSAIQTPCRVSERHGCDVHRMGRCAD